DDERNIRKTLAVCLESLGCAVTECGTAATAIDSLARLPHDLAFVDLRLGKESGLDLLGSLLAERPALEVIIITAYATIDTADDVPLLLRGESGTGKTVLARALHRQSPRRGRPFAVVNCPALSEELLTSEMFGHVKGAFTGAVRDQPGRVEAAEGGTLFLDE